MIGELLDGRALAPTLSTMDWTAHWGSIYASHDADEVSWFEASPEVSLRRVREAIDAGGRSVIDVGGGASRLVDRLLELDLDRIGVLDVSAGALRIAKLRLGMTADSCGVDRCGRHPCAEVGTFDVWHDRAVFHFLLDPSDRKSYVELFSGRSRLAAPRSSRRSHRTDPRVAAGCPSIGMTRRRLRMNVARAST